MGARLDASHLFTSPERVNGCFYVGARGAPAALARPRPHTSPRPCFACRPGLHGGATFLVLPFLFSPVANNTAWLSRSSPSSYTLLPLLGSGRRFLSHQVGNTVLARIVLGRAAATRRRKRSSAPPAAVQSASGPNPSRARVRRVRLNYDEHCNTRQDRNVPSSWGTVTRGVRPFWWQMVG